MPITPVCMAKDPSLLSEQVNKVHTVMKFFKQRAQHSNVSTLTFFMRWLQYFLVII